MLNLLDVINLGAKISTCVGGILRSLAAVL